MHSCSNDGVIQLGPLSSDAMFEVVEISDVCFVAHYPAGKCTSRQKRAGYPVTAAAAVHRWRRHLSACVKAGGGHFEHCFEL